MSGFRSIDGGVTRRRLPAAPRAVIALLSSCVLIAGSVLAGCASPRAAGARMFPQQPEGQASSDCGSDADTDPLWLDVKDATPTNPGNNVKVVFVAKTPKGHDYGYAIHNGQRGGKSQYDFLLIPTLREKGIECHRIWEPGALNLFAYAFDNLGILPAGTDWALGIESANNRSHEQLHIHVSRLADGVRDDLNKAENSKAGITTEVTKWSGDIISVKGKNFRALRNPNAKGLWDHNVFDTLQIYVAPNDPPGSKPNQPSMADQTMLVTASSKGGVIAIDSDKVSPQTKPNGVDNIEFLLNKK